MKVSLLVMTLNEINGMKAIMPKIRRDWVDQIIVVDGGSTDGTVEWAREQNYQVYIQQQPGFRHAYFEVWPYVEGDVVITFSPDGNSIPELIPELVARMREGYDMIIASRYLGAAKSEDDDLLTGFGNWLFTKTVRVLLGGNLTDVMVIYRAYKKQVIHDLELDQDTWYTTPETLFGCKISWEPLLSARAVRMGLKLTEIPGDEPPRIGGERKLLIWRWGASYYFQVWREYFLALADKWRGRKPTG